MNTQKIFIVEYDGRTIGVWDSYDSANTFIMGCQQNSLMISSANIKTYQINTCFCLETNTIEESNNSLDLTTKASVKQTNILKSYKYTRIPTNNNTVINNDEHENKFEQIETKPNIDIKNPMYVEIIKQKIELQHKINMLKQQKKKIEESKNTYTNDYKLFALFTESKQKDSNFVIPEIFIKKFNLMTQLNNENRLSWENFVKDFQQENLYNEYFGLNNYEEMFLKSDDDESKNNISEELDIESNSNTETSNDSDDDNK